MGMDQIAAARMLQAAHAHRPVFGERIARSLGLKAKRMQQLARGGQQASRVGYKQVDDTLSGAGGHAGAAHMVKHKARVPRMDQRN